MIIIIIASFNITIKRYEFFSIIITGVCCALISYFFVQLDNRRNKINNLIVYMNNL